jgi:hypothetical protein
MRFAAKVPQGKIPSSGVKGLSHKPNCQRANAPRQAPAQIANTAYMNERAYKKSVESNRAVQVFCGVKIKVAFVPS